MSKATPAGTTAVTRMMRNAHIGRSEGMEKAVQMLGGILWLHKRNHAAALKLQERWDALFETENGRNWLEHFGNIANLARDISMEVARCSES